MNERLKDNIDKVMLSELLGILLTDGSLWFKTSSNCFCISLTNKSLVLLRRFQELMKNLFGISNFNWEKSQAGIPEILCRSKNAALLLLGLVNTCRTSPCESCVNQKCCKICNPVKFDGKSFSQVILPDFILKDKHCITKFLQLAFSCDGTVVLSVKRDWKKSEWKLHREVTICSKNPFMKSHFQTLLLSLGLKNPRNTEKGIELSNKEDICTFEKMIGFVNGVEVTKGFWKGFSKNFILSLTTKSFEWVKKFKLQSFLSKEEILNSILKFSQTGSF